MGCDLCTLFLLFNLLELLTVVYGQHSGGGGGAQNRMGGGMGGAANGMNNGNNNGGGGGPNNKGLPPGYANIRGEIMDMTNKLIQRITQAGTNYFTYDNQNGAPIFRRREVDANRRFVIFPDLQYPPGDGHYIVLRKMPGVIIPGMIPQALYESFRLSLGDSIHAYITEFNKNDPPNNVNTKGFNGLAASYGQSTSGYAISNQPTSAIGMMQGKRKKREQINAIEIIPINFGEEQT